MGDWRRKPVTGNSRVDESVDGATCTTRFWRRGYRWRVVERTAHGSHGSQGGAALLIEQLGPSL